MLQAKWELYYVTLKLRVIRRTPHQAVIVYADPSSR